MQAEEVNLAFLKGCNKFVNKLRDERHWTPNDRAILRYLEKLVRLPEIKHEPSVGPTYLGEGGEEDEGV